jgi:hypothetical protein
MDRRAVEVGQEAPFLLRIRHVAPFARDGVGAFAALKSERDQAPLRASNTFFKNYGC